MEKTIEIPEGYEARIEGNKVILEQKESEDEKVRKEIISFIKEFEKDHYRCIDFSHWIAYLERQKEQKPVEIDEYEIIKKHITEDALSGEVNKRLKECGWYIADERPAEWSLEQLKMFDDILVAIELDNGLSAGRQKELIQLLNTCRINASAKTRWSQKDNEKIERLRSIVNNYAYLKGVLDVNGDYCEGDYAELDDFLKSLRPQPKAELTLLDENIINAAVAFVKQNDHFNCWGGIDKHMVIIALRSLKPHWKPSEEQMEALDDAIGILGYMRAANTLRELYIDLKKL